MWDDCVITSKVEGALITDPHMSFTKTTGLRAFEVVQFFLYRLILGYYKNAWFRSKLKLKLYSLSCVLIVAKHDGYM